MFALKATAERKCAKCWTLPIQATSTMVFKLEMEAEKLWRRLNGHQLFAKVIEGVKFINGELKEAAA
jgi:hypothetical protein